MNRKLFESNLDEFRKLESEETSRIEKSKEYMKFLSLELEKCTSLEGCKDVFQREIERQESTKEEIQRSIESINIPAMQAKLSEENSRFISTKDKSHQTNARKLEIDIKIQRQKLDALHRKQSEIVEKLEKFRTSSPESIRDILEQYQAQTKTSIISSNMVLDNARKKIEADKKELEKIESRPKNIYISDPNIEAHHIKRALNSNVKESISSFKLNKDTLKKIPHFMRSKAEKGKDRAELLIRARIFESEMEAENEDDRYYETNQAIQTLNAWIAANSKYTEEEEKEFKEKYSGDEVELRNLYQLTNFIINNNMFLSEEKFSLAVSFFLISAYEYCYNLFESLLISPYTRVLEKAEACKFLYYSGDNKYIKHIEEYTKQIIRNNELEDRFRYETIACYVDNLGLKSKYIARRLNIDGVDVELVVNLFKEFITLDVHPDYKIYAATFLLEQEENQDVKKDVIAFLFDMAKSTSFPKVDPKNVNKIHRIRADAADVITRLGDEEARRKAFEIIMELGEEDEEAEIDRTVYTNTENVHLLNEKTIEYIEHVYSNTPRKFSKIDEIYRHIEMKADKFKLDLDSKESIRRSLDRIMLDPARFTKYKISAADILLSIYNKIHSYDKTTIAHLSARLLEELCDMADTCATGHAKRLVNTLVGFDDKLEGIMDFRYQLEANIKARLKKSLAEHPDRDNLADAAMEGSENRDLYLSTCRKIFDDSIKKDLLEEFVTPGYLSEQKFKEISSAILEKL